MPGLGMWKWLNQLESEYQGAPASPTVHYCQTMWNQYAVQVCTAKGDWSKDMCSRYWQHGIAGNTWHSFAKRRRGAAVQGRRLATQMDEMCELLPKMIALRQQHGRKSTTLLPCWLKLAGSRRCQTLVRIRSDKGMFFMSPPFEINKMECLCFICALFWIIFFTCFHMFSHHFTPSLGTCEWTWTMTAKAVTPVGSSMRWTAQKKTCNWNGAFELELSKNNVWTVWHWTDIVTIVGQFSRGRGVRASALREPQCTGRKVQDLPINIEHRFDMNWTMLHYASCQRSWTVHVYWISFQY